MKMWISGSALIALAACSGNNGAGKDTVAPTALVQLVRVSDGTVQATTTVYGAVDAGPSARVDLVALAEATVTRIVAPIGTRVRVGQVVAVLSPSPMTRLELARAGSDSQAATLAFERMQRLRRDGLVSDAEVEAARAAARTATATRASLKTRTDTMTLRTPVDGFVASVSVSPGALVAPGGTVVTVTRNDTARARFGVPPEVARTIQIGQPIRLATPQGLIVAQIASIDPAVDPQTKLASIYAVLPPGTPAGALISATLMTGRGQRGVVIPYPALLDDAGQPFVYVVIRGVAHRRNVVIGDEASGRVAISSGLKVDEVVVIAGGTAVEDGMKVRTR